MSNFFFSSRRRHTTSDRDWSSDVCSSDLRKIHGEGQVLHQGFVIQGLLQEGRERDAVLAREEEVPDHLDQLRPHVGRSEEHTSELQSRSDLVCRLLLEKKKKKAQTKHND